MIRNLFRLVMVLVVFAIVRMLIAGIWKMFQQATGANTPARPQAASGVHTGGELKKDPVCGTFVSADTAVTATIRGELVHFCSTACRDKFGRA